MSSTNLCVLLICVVTFQALVVEAVLPVCTGDTPACDIDNADSCSGADPDLCLCNVNYVESGATCALIATCTTAADDCGTGTACTTDDTPKCSCLANFETSAAAPTTTCTQITCDADTTSKCTEANSYCVDPNCVCKINFVGTGKANCDRIECDDDNPCTVANSACHTGDNAGCGCDTLHTADATTGACTTRKPCTDDATVTATCGSNTVCELSGNAYKCFCKANYLPMATECVIDTCSVDDDCEGLDDKCTAPNCGCADTFTPSGSICKTDCSTDAALCHENAACVSGVCECNVNFEGNGAACAAMTGCQTGGVEVCHPNSECTTDTCGCADGWVTDGTVCKKSCTSANAADTCGDNASCVSDKCECNVNYIGDGATCTQKTCTVADMANCDADSKCSSDKCTCDDNFVGNSQACECPTGFSVVGGSCKKTCAQNTDCTATKATCFNSSCECEPNYMGNAATACTQIACNGTNTDSCVEKSTCENEKCACTSGSFGAVNDELVCADAGCETIFCNFSLLMASLLMVFFASKRFE